MLKYVLRYVGSMLLTAVGGMLLAVTLDRLLDDPAEGSGDPMVPVVVALVAAGAALAMGIALAVGVLVGWWVQGWWDSRRGKTTKSSWKELKALGAVISTAVSAALGFAFSEWAKNSIAEAAVPWMVALGGALVMLGSLLGLRMYRAIFRLIWDFITTGRPGPELAQTVSAGSATQ